MNVLFLGAAGQMAQPALQILAHNSAISQLTMADRRLDSIPDITLSNSAKAQKVILDVQDQHALMEQMEGKSLVINTTGPYYLLAETIVRCAVESRCNYVDICDDWEPTKELLKLDNWAKDQGVSVLLGAGASPGITNLLARKAADQLDSVRKLYTGWSIHSDSDITAHEIRSVAQAQQVPAAIIHWMQQISGTIQVWSNGRLHQTQPLKSYVFQYPGEGKIQGWSVGHPEAITLPRRYQDVQECANLMVDVGNKILLLKALSLLIKLRTLNTLSAARLMKTLAKLVLPFVQLNDDDTTSLPKSMPALFAWAEGKLNGESKQIAYGFQPEKDLTMAELTSIPLACFAELFLAGSPQKTGVITPEELEVNQGFFDKLSTRLNCSSAGLQSI